MSQSMPPNEIRAELVRRGISLAEIGRQAGVSKEAVSMVVSGRYSYKGYRVRPYIAKALGRKVTEIWPDHKENVATIS